MVLFTRNIMVRLLGHVLHPTRKLQRSCSLMKMLEIPTIKALQMTLLSLGNSKYFVLVKHTLSSCVSNILPFPGQTNMLSCMKRSSLILPPQLQSAFLICCHLLFGIWLLLWRNYASGWLYLLVWRWGCSPCACRPKIYRRYTSMTRYTDY